MTSPLDETLALLLFPAAVTALNYNYAHARKIVLLFSGYVAASFVGVVWVPNFGVPQPLAFIVDMLLDMKGIIIFLGFYFFFVSSDNVKQRVVFISKCFLAFALVNSAFIILDALFGGGNSLVYQIPLPTWNLGGHRLTIPMGFVSSKMRSAWLTGIGLLCSYYLYRESLGVSPRKITKALQAATIFLFVVFIAHLSNKEIIAIFVLTILKLFMESARESRAKLFKNLLGVGAVLAFLAVTNVIPIFTALNAKISSYIGVAGADKARTLMSLVSVLIAEDHFPFGSGGGTFGSMPSVQYGYSDLYYEYGLNLIFGLGPEAHEFAQDVYWPKILAQSGVIGLLFYIAIYIYLFRRIFSGYLKYRDNESFLYVSVFVFVLFVSIASSPFADEYIGVVFWLFMAAALADFYPSRARGDKICRSRPSKERGLGELVGRLFRRPKDRSAPHASRAHLVEMPLVRGHNLLNRLVASRRLRRNAGFELSRKTPPRSNCVFLSRQRNTP
jgi:hypothetical protein